MRDGEFLSIGGIAYSERVTPRSDIESRASGIHGRSTIPTIRRADRSARSGVRQVPQYLLAPTELSDSDGIGKLRRGGAIRAHVLGHGTEKMPLGLVTTIRTRGSSGYIVGHAALWSAALQIFWRA